MKQPNFYFNRYYPFYTQTTFGKKTKSYYHDTVFVHLSRERGFKISIEYYKRKVEKVIIKPVEYPSLSNSIKDGSFISYNDFSAVAKTAYNHLASALKKLKKRQPYCIVFCSWFATYFKFDKTTELNFSSDEISLCYGNFDYSIENEIKVEPDKPTISNYQEWDEIGKTLKAIDDCYKYRTIAEDDFIEGVNRYWERCVDYFEAPKCLRKTEYRL